MSDATQTGWQPIDNAPEDEDIMVFTRHWGTIIARRSSEFGEWLSRMQVPVAMSGDDEAPTHWQVLPADPEGVERA